MSRVQFKYTMDYKILDGKSGWFTEEFTNQAEMCATIGQVLLENDCKVIFEIEKEKLAKQIRSKNKVKEG